MPDDSTSQALADLAAMHRIRFLEEKITELRKQQIVQGSVHLCIGQESIYVGARGALRDEDRVFSTYRGHGWAMACGVPAEGILAELMGRETGVCRGRGGSAMFSAADHGFYGENSIVGAGAPIACAAALAARVKGEPRVALAAFGDGLRPIVEIMWIDFSLVAMDPIVNQAANVRYVSAGRLAAPLTIRTQQGATPGSCAQHSQNLEAMFAHVPGLRVGLPATAHSGRGGHRPARRAAHARDLGRR